MSNAATTSALLLFALAGAFLFAYTWRLTKYLILRLEGQQLIFMAAGFAVPLLIVSRLVLLSAPHIFAEPLVAWVGRTWNSFVGPAEIPALATFAGAFVLGPALGGLLNLFFSRSRTSAYIIRRYGDGLEQFLYESMKGPLLIAVNLDNRKVYIQRISQ